MKMIHSLLTLLILVALALPASAQAASQDEIKESIDKGLKWLRTQMEENGSWQDYPGITALCMTAYAKSPRKYTEEDGPFMARPARYLLSLQKENGAIYKDFLPAYNTNVALVALWNLQNPEYEEAVRKAQEFIASLQCDESLGYDPDNKFYGGIGYGNDERPDLSNLQLALEAMKESCYDEKAELWGKALAFIQRCQNLEEYNDQESSGNDGGFIYYPGNSPAGESLDGTRTVYRSYGSMTYAGIKSFIYAGLDKDDPRVKAALNWIAEHYSLDENYPIGNQGLYYYYHTFARTFAVLGEKTIRDANGVEHHWANELGDKLIALQSPEGFWANESGRWWEGNPVLATAYAVLALNEAYAFADKEPAP